MAIYSTQDAKGLVSASNFTPDLLGGKGYNLIKMAAKGIPVPLAFVLPTDYCRDYQKDPEAVLTQLKKNDLPFILAQFKKQRGYVPLLSVRSGAKFSMPGMMDTILNVGLDHDTFSAWKKKLGNDCAINSWERLIEMYGNVVNGIPRHDFEGQNITARLATYEKVTGKAFPDAEIQLINAVEAVFKSWNNERAKTYRKLNSIPDDLGTAVVIQAMVFGNLNKESCTGVLFSRDPNTGEKKLTGEFLINAQGEDVVAGIRTPEPLSKLKEWDPAIAEQLESVVVTLERMNRDMQDVEFTVQDGELFILQTRNGKRTAQAAVRIAVELFEGSAISAEELRARVRFSDFIKAIRPVIAPDFKGQPDFKGLPASTGIASGVAVFSSADAVNCKEPCILITKETTPDDLAGMHAAKGILTQTGGATSHAAVVARGMNRPCVVGVTGLEVSESAKTAVYAGQTIKAGTLLTIDGATGNVYVGVKVPVTDGSSNPYVKRFINAVVKGVDFYRVLTSLNEVEAVDEGNQFVFGTFELDRLGDGALVYNTVKEAAEKLSGKNVVFDLRGIYQINSDPLVNVFCNDGETRNYLNSKIVALADAKADKANFRFITDGKLGNVEQKWVAKLKGEGCTDIPALNNLDALVTAEGLCVVDFDRLCTVNNPETIEAIIELKKKAGQTVRSFNIVPEVTPENLQSGAVFALTPVALVRSLIGVE